ncbi:response regulator|uniref:Response regulator n=1 Tax=Leuconostoc lactis TaxID=1246 RepID=A0A6L7A704_LEULA|nr:response regulator [Leuconostoc lactis]
MTKILVVDDEAAISTLLQYNLEENNYDVTVAEDGQTAYQLASQQQFEAKVRNAFGIGDGELPVEEADDETIEAPETLALVTDDDDDLTDEPIV